MSAENSKEYFTDRRMRCLSVRSIEKESGIPLQTLDHFLKGRRQLNENHIQKLTKVLKEFGYE